MTLRHSLASNRSRMPIGRRGFLGTSTAMIVAAAQSSVSTQLLADDQNAGKAKIAITFDLEMSRHYPQRGMMEWDYQKGNLDEATKQYSLKAARIAKALGGMIHFFCVGRVLEQSSVDWLKELAGAGHSIGNHTYDHVNLLADSPTNTQFRFQRSPWLVSGQTTSQVLRENIRLTNVALQERVGIEANGFRTPGGFPNGLSDREDLQMMLLDLGFTWISSKYPRHIAGETGMPPTPEVYEDIVRAQQDAQPFSYPTGLVEIPMSPISDVNAFRNQRWELKSFKKAVRLAVQWAIDSGGVFDFLCHPSCMVVEDPDCQVVRLICDLVKQAGESAAIVDLGSIARERMIR